MGDWTGFGNGIAKTIGSVVHISEAHLTADTITPNEASNAFDYKVMSTLVLSQSEYFREVAYYLILARLLIATNSFNLVAVFYLFHEMFQLEQKYVSMPLYYHQ